MKICEKSLTSTGSNISHLKIAMQCNRDKKNVNNVYTEHINVNSKNVENVEKLFLKGEIKKTYVYMSSLFFRGVELSFS